MMPLGIGKGSLLGAVTDSGGGGGGGGPSDPPVPAADCTQWWAEDLTLSNGDPVTTWAAKVDDLGLGAYTQATAAKQPTFVASDSDLNSKKSVDFDGTGDRLDGTNTITDLTGDVTMVAVMVPDNVGSNDNVMTTNNVSARQQWGVGGGDWQIYNGFSTSRAGHPEDGVAYLGVAVFGGPDTVDANGYPQVSGSTGSENFDSTALSGNAADSSQYYDGRVAFAMVVNGTLTAGELASLASWVESEYGIVYRKWDGSFEETIMDEVPYFYWICDEASGSLDDSRHWTAYNQGPVTIGSATGLQYRQATTLVPNDLDGVSILMADTTDQVSFSGRLSSLSAVTFELWFQPTILAVGSIMEAGGGTQGLQLSINGSGNLVVDHANAGVTLTSVATLSIGTPYHIVVTADNSAIRLYIDGSEDNALTAGSYGTATGSDDGAIGAHNGSSAGGISSAARGYYAHVAGYNSVLSASTISSHYTAGTA